MLEVLPRAAGTPEATPTRCSRQPDLPPARRYSPLLDVIRAVAVIGVVGVHVIADHVDAAGPVAMLVLRPLLATAVPTSALLSSAPHPHPTARRHSSTH